MKRVNEFYRVIEKGTYACIVCGKIYSGASARHAALRCCHDKKPYSEYIAYQADEVLAKARHQDTPRTAKPGNGVLRKNQWGHWRRGKPTTKPQANADYHKAMSRIQQHRLQDTLKRLNDIYETPEQYLAKFQGKHRTALQRMAWAYINRNWEAVKQAAYDLASELAITNRVEEWTGELSIEALYQEAKRLHQSQKKGGKT